jgi:hypothetical protein
LKSGLPRVPDRTGALAETQMDRGKPLTDTLALSRNSSF